MTDIVIPCLIPNEKWYKDYKNYNFNEHPGRIRDLEILKFVLRSIEKNAKWVNKVFLCFYDKSQIPNWLNTKNEKLIIKEHADFIPKKYLPNFNSVIVDMNLHNIDELSEQFIFFNDDMIFLKEIPETFYFKNGKTVHQKTIKEVNNYNFLTKAQWGKIELNNYNFLNNIIGKKLFFSTNHLPFPLKKSFQKFLWFKYRTEFENALSDSKIRSDKNVCNWLFYNIEEYYNLCTFDDIYVKFPSKFLGLSDNTTLNFLKSALNEKYIIGLNDGNELNKNFDKVKKDVNDFLLQKFPNKSSFEV